MPQLLKGKTVQQATMQANNQLIPAGSSKLEPRSVI